MTDMTKRPGDVSEASPFHRNAMAETVSGVLCHLVAYLFQEPQLVSADTTVTGEASERNR